MPPPYPPPRLRLAQLLAVAPGEVAPRPLQNRSKNPSYIFGSIFDPFWNPIWCHVGSLFASFFVSDRSWALIFIKNADVHETL